MGRSSVVKPGTLSIEYNFLRFILSSSRVGATRVIYDIPEGFCEVVDGGPCTASRDWKYN